MAAKVCVSECCNAQVKTGTSPESGKEVPAIGFICLQCNKPCKVVKKRALVININDDIEIRLTKEGRKLYKEYTKKYWHQPLKKSGDGWTRIAFFEFMYIFGPRMFMGAEAVIVGNTIRIIKEEDWVKFQKGK